MIERRLRAARPPQATVEADVDLELLRRVMAQPAAPVALRRRRRIALPATAAAVLAAAVVFVAAGPPGAGGPAGARAAIARSLHWFDPPAGSVLHVRSEMTSRVPGGATSTLIQESWQSVDRPGVARRAEPGVETDASGALYDVATNTIYPYVAPPEALTQRHLEAAMDAKIRAAKAAGASPEVIARLRHDRRTVLQGLTVKRPPSGPGEPRVGDALVNQMRDLLRSGDAQVGDETTFDGIPAFPITFSPGGARWTMWARAGDGRPLELRVDGAGPLTAAARGLETVRWPAYEVVPGDGADRLLTVAGAHPDARIVRSAEAWQAALQRLYPHG